MSTSTELLIISSNSMPKWCTHVRKIPHCVGKLDSRERFLTRTYILPDSKKKYDDSTEIINFTSTLNVSLKRNASRDSYHFLVILVSDGDITCHVFFLIIRLRSGKDTYCPPTHRNNYVNFCKWI